MIKFSPNCTLPSTAPAFVTAPNARSTLQIVWQCLSILILCTWSVLHLNVPPQVQPRSKKETIYRVIFHFSRKLKWMLVNIIAPEFTFGKAICNYGSAHHNHAQLQALADEDGVPWSISHTYFADMGGITISFDDEVFGEPSPALLQPSPKLKIQDPTNDEPSPIDATDGHLQLVTFDRYLEPRTLEFYTAFPGRSMDRLREFGDSKWKKIDRNRIMALEVLKRTSPESLKDRSIHTFATSLSTLTGNIWVLNAAQLATARRLGAFERLPYLTEDELKDKSENEFLVKGLAVVQILWMVVQLTVRALKSKPSTQLEIMTLSFAACMIGTFVIHWKQPQGVNTPVNVPGTTPTKEQFAAIARLDCTTFFFRRRYYTIPNNGDKIQYPKIGGYPLGGISFGLAIGGIILGAFHILAWNFTFPTEVEKKLWRITTLFATLFPAAAAMVNGAVYDIFQLLTGKVYGLSVKSWYTWILFGSVAVFVLARFFLLVEAFRSLYYLPPEAFSSTWTGDFPGFFS